MAENRSVQTQLMSSLYNDQDSKFKDRDNSFTYSFNHTTVSPSPVDGDQTVVIILRVGAAVAVCFILLAILICFLLKRKRKNSRYRLQDDAVFEGSGRNSWAKCCLRYWRWLCCCLGHRDGWQVIHGVVYTKNAEEIQILYTEQNTSSVSNSPNRNLTHEQQLNPESQPSEFQGTSQGRQVPVRRQTGASKSDPKDDNVTSEPTGSGPSSRKPHLPRSDAKLQPESSASGKTKASHKPEKEEPTHAMWYPPDQRPQDADDARSKSTLKDARVTKSPRKTKQEEEEPTHAMWYPPHQRPQDADDARSKSKLKDARVTKSPRKTKQEEEEATHVMWYPPHQRPQESDDAGDRRTFQHGKTTQSPRKSKKGKEEPTHVMWYPPNQRS